ncbi:uncharacterized protein [Cardiocondyla obscurior]|uniref:uncharacterized protein n=1 Tax=Cardiocondyla obscurior TaxID=286306 RepID=UPI003965840E
MNNEPLPGIIAFTECVLIVTTLSYFIIQLMVSCAPCGVAINVSYIAHSATTTPYNNNFYVTSKKQRSITEGTINAFYVEIAQVIRTQLFYHLIYADFLHQYLFLVSSHWSLSRHPAKYSASFTCEITFEIFGTECGTSDRGTSV